VLIKSADDQSAAIAALAALAAGTGPDAKRAASDLRKRKAGLKGEAESAYLIDFEFADSRNWAVIHDLRLEHAGRVAQIDHLLINRWMDVYVLESKHFHAALRITDDGEFQQYNKYGRTWLGLPSPLMQNERHIAVLRDAMSAIELPMRIGMRISPTFHSLVLVAPSARIDRPKRFDASRVIKADQLKHRIWKDIDDANLFQVAKSVANIVSRETMEFVALQLAVQHRPFDRAPAAPVKAAPAPAASTSTSTGPACKACTGADGDIRSGKYGYYFKCRACEANTAIRFTCQPGHAPRLRKDKLAFYRECEQCGTSILFHRVPGPA
jgi:hypothetical protein